METFVDHQWVVSILVLLVSFLGGFFVRDLKKTLEWHERRLRHVEVNYLPKVDFEKSQEAVFKKLDKIYDGVTECRILHAGYQNFKPGVANVTIPEGVIHHESQ